MPKAKSAALLGLVESEDEDTSEILEPITQAKKVQNMPPVKRGRPAAADTTRSRKVLADKPSNAQPAPQGRGKKRPATEDIEAPNTTQDEITMEAAPKPKTARGRPRTAKVAKLSSTPEELLALDDVARPVVQPVKRGRKPKAQVATPPTEVEIPETQHPLAGDPAGADFEIPETQPVEIFETLDDSIDDEQFEDLPSYSRAAISSVQRMQPHYMVPSSALRGQPLVPMSTSRMRHHVPFNAGRLPMAALDPEANDPSLRRRIGDLTRKYDNLEARYRDLRDIGVKEAELNYDRLKKQGEERANSKSPSATCCDDSN